VPPTSPDRDLVVVGAGAAGLFASLTAAATGAGVTLVSARPLAETASYWAQGGIAAAIAEEDSVHAHLADTLEAGRGLVRRSAAEILCAEAPARFSDLVSLGVSFDADRAGNVALGLEGGHSARRVAHAGGSATGRRILRQLSAQVAGHPRIDVIEGRRAAALLTDAGGARVGGVAFADGGDPIVARAVILATGGAAAMWSRTTNPPGSFGSGLLLGASVGAPLADLEFVQFHPTAVVGIPGREGFLISEAVRGEGATGARRARKPLPDGRDRLRPRRPLRRPRALRRGRVRLHRSARREPPRVELPVGVLRLRPASGAGRSRRAGPARSGDRR
jgi:L-aspartate oxidase